MRFSAAGLDRSDAIKLTCSAIGAIAAAMYAASPATWADAFKPAPVLGAIVGLCSLIPTLYANKPKDRQKPEQPAPPAED